MVRTSAWASFKIDGSQSQVRAANSLLSITHSMKLLLLLSDEAQLAHRRDAELKIVREETKEARKKVAELLDDILHRPTS